MLRLFVEGILLFFIVFLLIYANTTAYLASQLRGFAADIHHPASLEAYYRDGKVSKEEWAFLQNLFRFAEKDLGLNQGQSYLWAIDPRNWPSLLMVTAADTNSIKPYSHQLFDLISFPYLGFYSKKQAVNYIHALRAKGLTVSINPVAGFSLGGWLPDPFIIPWLKNDKGRLAELILHELAHRTWYDAGNMILNEQYASVVGREGATAFLGDLYGRSSSEFLNYEHTCRVSDAVERFAFRMMKRIKTNQALPSNHPQFKHNQELFKYIASLALADTSLPAGTRRKVAAAIITGRNAWFASHATYNDRNNDVYWYYSKHYKNRPDLLIKAFVSGKYQDEISSK